MKRKSETLRKIVIDAGLGGCLNTLPFYELSRLYDECKGGGLKSALDKYFKRIINKEGAIENFLEYCKYLEENGFKITREYIRLTYNCKTEQEISEKLIEYRTSLAPPKEKYIETHGEKEGLERYNFSIKTISNIDVHEKSVGNILYGIVLSIDTISEDFKKELLNDIEMSKDKIDNIVGGSQIFSKSGTNKFNSFWYIKNQIEKMENASGAGVLIAERLIMPRKLSPYSTLESIQKYFNCSLERAKEIKKENEDHRRGRKLEDFIRRHGEEEGQRRYKQMIEKCSAANEKKKKLYKDEYYYKVRVNNKRCKEYYTSRGFSEEEAKQLAREYQVNNSGVHKSYWIKKGFSEEEAEEKIKEIDSKKASGYEYMKEKYPDDWRDIMMNRFDKYRKTINCVEPEWQDDLKDYGYECRRLTKYTLNFFPEKVSGIEHKDDEEYQLDHKFSIKAGFLAGVEPKVIASFHNLEYIPKFDNASKGDSCSIDINELYRGFYQEVMNEN